MKLQPKNVEELLEHILKIITSEENNELVRTIEENEIKNVIWSLEPDKAPDPDNFSISFYRYFWYLIKHDLRRMLQYYHRSYKLGGNMNSSFFI
jgi:hypothetical protein